MFTTEIRNDGPDRVTGLSLVESSSANLELNVSPAVNGISGDFATSIWDSLVRLPALQPGQNFVWQRTYVARSAGSAWPRVRVDRFDQTPLAALPDNNAAFNVQPAQADLELQLLEAPTVGQEMWIPPRRRTPLDFPRCDANSIVMTPSSRTPIGSKTLTRL